MGRPLLLSNLCSGRWLFLLVLAAVVV